MGISLEGGQFYDCVSQQILSVGRADQMETKVVFDRKAATQILQERGIFSFSQDFHKNMKWIILTHFIIIRECPSLTPVFSEIPCVQQENKMVGLG